MARRGLRLLLPALLVLGLPWSAVADSQQTVEKKSRELESVKTQIQQLRNLLNRVKDEHQEQSSELQRTEEKIGQIARRVRVIGQSLRRQRQRLAGLEEERAVSNRQLDRHRQRLERQIRAAYAMGRQEKIKILLNQQDPAVVSRMMVYYDYLNLARVAQIGLIQKSLDKLALIEQEIAAEESRLQQLFAKEQQERQQLELAREGRREIIAKLSNQLKSKGEELEGLRADEKELYALLSSLQQALSDIPLDPMANNPFKNLKGKLPWPSKGKVLASFGAAREVGGLRWDGVLIGAPEGREVRSVHHGRVAFADWLRGFGLLLIIDHGDGYMSLYGHNQSLFKETGEWVEPGEVVAEVGSSGGRSTPGVYFGLRHNGQPINPAKWCKRIRGGRITGMVPAGALQPVA